ncbi:peptidoglycan editing factor PgeF [Thioalkalivibrio sp. HK1]|uniref:peptidoglycan editing factor PgeF n=1 Tax=Thioalkalivibrio sp. HK1 TaxID=1469245 RepID=UPI00047254DB|nr:peptidoglycan editing factor PgeF [Thioalkalivibrio sp. HK1]
MTPLSIIEARWPAPPGVRALSTTRSGGASSGAWSSLNLGIGNGDDPAQVMRNRQRLRAFLDLPAEPLWLDQVHGKEVFFADDALACAKTPKADACIARPDDPPCAVLSADCLPVALCDNEARRVGIAHAGWRGLAKGVIPACIEAMECEPDDLLAWLGPAIGPEAYEVGEEVRDAFANGGFDDAFRPTAAGKWQANLFAIARLQIKNAGVHRIYGGDLCTFADSGRFFSHRRDRGITGRMATLIWIAPSVDRPPIVSKKGS